MEKAGRTFPSLFPTPPHTQCVRFPSWYTKALSSWVCHVDCFCFTLLESEHGWWAVIFTRISELVFSSKRSLCYSQVKTRLMQIFHAWENSKWQEQQIRFYMKNVGMRASGTFFVSKLPPLAMCTYCDSVHSSQHFIFSLHLGKIVYFYILVKGTLLVIKYTMCPRIAGIIVYLILKLGASCRVFVHVRKGYYPSEHVLEHMCQHFNVKKPFFSPELGTTHRPWVKLWSSAHAC